MPHSLEHFEIPTEAARLNGVTGDLLCRVLNAQRVAGFPCRQ